MIVRILGEGQFSVDEAATVELNKLDTQLEAAVERNDETAFTAALHGLLDQVRALGAPLPSDALEPSDRSCRPRTRAWTRSASCSPTTGSSPADAGEAPRGSWSVLTGNVRLALSVIQVDLS